MKHKKKIDMKKVLRRWQRMQRKGCQKPKEASMSRRQFRRKTG